MIIQVLVNFPSEVYLAYCQSKLGGMSGTGAWVITVLLFLKLIKIKSGHFVEIMCPFSSTTLREQELSRFSLKKLMKYANVLI